MEFQQIVAFLESIPYAIEVLKYGLFSITIIIPILFIHAYFTGREVAFYPPKLGPRPLDFDGNGNNFISDNVNQAFDLKVGSILEGRKKITSLDIYAVTGGSFSKSIEHREDLDISSIRFILPSRRSIINTYDTSYDPSDSRILYDCPKKAMENIYAEIDQTRDELSNKIKNGSNVHIGSASFRAFNAFPSFYYAIIDNRELIFGEYIYKRNEGRFGMKPGKPVHIDDEDTAIKAKFHFESMWNLSKEIEENYVVIESVQQYYDQIGGAFLDHYSAIISGERTKSERNDLEMIINIISDHSKENLLDAGCGPAYWSNYYASQVESVTLLDFSPNMMDAAVNNIRKINSDIHISSVVSSIEEYSRISDCKFDVIILGFVLSHYSIEHASLILSYLKSILTSDGVVIIVDSLLLEGNQKTNKTIHKQVITKDKNIIALKHYFQKSEVHHVLKSSGLIVREQYFGSHYFSTVVHREEHYHGLSMP